MEGFLYSTLVDGSGLVLDKLDSDGKGRKSGVSEREKYFLPWSIIPTTVERARNRACVRVRVFFVPLPRCYLCM